MSDEQTLLRAEGGPVGGWFGFWLLTGGLFGI
jgi:hypothetical protein